MSDKNISLVLSGDETDSADEVFVFSQKRKADSFFIDLTEDEIEAKKQKRNQGDGGPEGNDGASEPEVEVVKFIPGDCAESKTVHSATVTVAQSIVMPSFSMLTVDKPIFCSPPHPVRLADGDLFKSSNVIDLTKSGAVSVHNEEIQSVKELPQPSTSQVVSVEDGGAAAGEVQESAPPPLPQNQLMDEEAAALYDADWFGNINLPVTVARNIVFQAYIYHITFLSLSIFASIPSSWKCK